MRSRSVNCHSWYSVVNIFHKIASAIKYWLYDDSSYRNMLMSMQDCWSYLNMFWLCVEVWPSCIPLTEPITCHCWSRMLTFVSSGPTTFTSVVKWSSAESSLNRQSWVTSFTSTLVASLSLSVCLSVLVSVSLFVFPCLFFAYQSVYLTRCRLMTLLQRTCANVFILFYRRQQEALLKLLPYLEVTVFIFSQEVFS